MMTRKTWIHLHLNFLSFGLNFLNFLSLLSFGLLNCLSYVSFLNYGLQIHWNGYLMSCSGDCKKCSCDLSCSGDLQSRCCGLSYLADCRWSCSGLASKTNAGNWRCFVAVYRTDYNSCSV